MYSYGSPHMAAQKQDDQLKRAFSSYVRIQDVVLKTYLRRWTIGRSGERGSGISVLPARYDDDDCSKRMALALNNLQKVDMPLNKETEADVFPVKGLGFIINSTSAYLNEKNGLFNVISTFTGYLKTKPYI